MKPVNSINDCMLWEIPGEQRRFMGIVHERDITPTKTLSAGIVILPPGIKQPKLSIHPDSEEIYFVIKGQGKFYLGDETYEIESGSVIFVAPGTRHRAANTGNEEMQLYFVNTPSTFGPIGGYLEFTKNWKRVR
jgi:mannose-6-phosphate isomerase-like protein (cupin superfamily)